MKTILFFGKRPYPTDHPVLETVFTRHLPELGYQPVWVMRPAAPEYSGQQALWNGTPVYVTRQRYRQPVLKQVEAAWEYLRLGAAVLRERPVDLVQARTGLIEGLCAWWLARRHGKPFVYQYSFPEALGRRERRRQQGRNRLFTEISYRLELEIVRFLMRQASLVLAISDTMRRIWEARGVKRIVSFPLGADVSVDPDAVTPAAAPPDTIGYFGSMAPERRLTFLIDVFQQVHAAVPTAHLLLVGDAEGSGLPEYVDQRGLRDSVTFVGRVPRREVPRYLKAMRCSLAPIPPEPMYTLSSPTKVVESLALGVPVVANREIDDQREIIEACGGGYVAPYETGAFAEAILRLLRDPADAAARGRAGRQFIEKHRSYAAMSQKLAEYYDQVLNAGAPREASALKAS